jgi:rhamnulokinase
VQHATFIATATHDTASAVAGIPADHGDDWAFLSCGTWSLIGRELRAPVTTPASLAENFTNEAGVAGTIRFLKNIQGLWMLQECQREWAARGRNFSTPELVRQASHARPFTLVVDPDDDAFLSPPSMLDAIRQFCRRTRQTMVDTPGAITRAILESLALKHRRALYKLEALAGGPVRVLHMVGGGSRNRLLCQWTADAIDRLVLAGPAEATAIGNAVVQGIALGWFADLRAARETIANSVRLSSYTPREQQDWARVDERFEDVVQRSVRRHAAQA